MKSRAKLLSVVISVAAAMSLCFGVVGQAFAANYDVDITGMNAGQAENAIDAAIADADTDSDAASTVTVIGVATGIAASIVIDIPDGVTVIWKAEYSGDVVPSALVSLAGEGVFRIESGKIENSNNTAAITLGHSDGAVGVVVAGGSVIASAPIAIAIIGFNDVVVSSGTVSASSPNGYAAGIVINDGWVTVSGGTVSAESDGNGPIAINAADGNAVINITGGTVTADGDEAAALLVGYRFARVVGGSVTATGDASAAIVIQNEGGAAAYLSGLVTGDLRINLYYGVIVEASVWNINPEDIGTTNNLTIVAIGEGTDPDENEDSEFDFAWEAYDSHSVCINLVNIITGLPDSDWETVNCDIPWGGFREIEEPEKPVTPGTGDMAIWVLAGAFILLVVGAGSLLVYRRRQTSN
ncbi:MAG: hypothetical protein FWD45_04760 [Coriobacteriia bacterium]|nr:hypothetical protein [Coriobacteriia bacterium]